MKTTTIENCHFFEASEDLSKDALQRLVNLFVDEYKKKLRFYFFFHASFFFLLFCEVIYFLIHSAWIVQSFLMAIHLSLIFGTFFCYLTVRMFFKTQKKERLGKLNTEFIDSYLKIIERRFPNCHLEVLVADACCQLTVAIHALENKIWACPSKLSFLSPLAETLNDWFFWQDLHEIKESLIQKCIVEHIKLVRLEPTSLEAHAGLANAYIMLSGLYSDGRTSVNHIGWLRKKQQDVFQTKFISVAKKAVEEFKILSDYAPCDPWVHAQLAYSYHDLEMPEEEIKEYEIILKLCPDDKETLFKLGQLYFEQGMNAKGLEIYETLVRSNYKNANQLINFYGTMKEL
jgi:tetratricopeptide (TPR) repeat protein